MAERGSTLLQGGGGGHSVRFRESTLNSGSSSSLLGRGSTLAGK